ncbi:hypothetical protein [Natronomonas amylolytica]|uniref:hypothetical protein n=1 Tax=Natronomonas amylolytica TaxID=3108498 RepID=UPI00300B3E0F
MSQEQQQRFTNRAVAVGVVVVCLVGIALGAAGSAIPRWVLPVVALLGSFVAVGYVGAKGYAIVEGSKQ